MCGGRGGGGRGSAAPPTSRARHSLLRNTSSFSLHPRLNTQSGYGWTALHYAGQAKQAGCVALLVAAGASRAIKNNKGKTAHDRAVAQQKLEIAELLA